MKEINYCKNNQGIKEKKNISYQKLESAFRELLDAHIDQQPEERQTTSYRNEWLEKAGLDTEKFEDGGEHVAKSEIVEDIAWDIGLEHGWVKNNEWVSEKEKGKAMAMAYQEANKYSGGGEAKANQISFIITGTKL